MKLKVFNLLALCFVTSGSLTPSQAAFGHSVERQINVEQAQHLISVKEEHNLLRDIEKSGERASESAQQQAVKEVKATEKLKSSTVNDVPQLLSPAQQKSIANIALWIGYLVPCGACLGIFLYDKYCAYRSALLKEQIDMLERLWKQTSQH
jgi:hypothetical protein